jgi:hypothetical protein
MKGCPRCAIGDHGRKKREDGVKHLPTEPNPTALQLEGWVIDSVCDATDGCQVEPDGHCPHGHPSWLLYLGLV